MLVWILYRVNSGNNELPRDRQNRFGINGVNYDKHTTVSF